MSIKHLPQYILDHYEVHEWKHACAILQGDYPDEWADIIEVLSHFKLYKSWISVGGGRKSNVAGALDGEFYRRGWTEKKFNTKVTVDEHAMNSPTHKVDCYRNEVGLEVEWNNKDPFFDRDLNNFRLLFDLRALHVGVIITRCDDLQSIFDAIGRGKSYGASTTHMSRLLPRIEGGSGGGCPILVFGIKSALYRDDMPGIEVEPAVVEDADSVDEDRT